MQRTTSALLFALVAGALSVAPLAGAPVQAASETRVVTGFSHPESVLIDGARRFVSNIGASLDPFGHDGDGFISELDADGRIVALHAFPSDGSTLDAPKGMALLAGRLYVADIDRIVGFDLATRRRVFEAKVPAGGPTLLNDVAVMGGALVVSDTMRATVWRVDVGSGAFTSVADGIPGANGIVRDEAGKRLLVVGLGAKFEGGDLFEIPDGGAARRIAKGPHGILDGLALLPDGRLVISDWRSIDPPKPGAVTIHAADGTTTKTVDFGREVHGPADFDVDVAKSEIWLPAMIDNAVVIAPLER